MQIKRLILALTSLTLYGCNCPLTVYTYTQTHSDLASSFVGTPDPRQCTIDFVGEKLIVDWHIAPKFWYATGGWRIKGTVLLGNGEEREFTHFLSESKGRYSWDLLGESYFEGEGLATFEVFLINEDCVFAYQKHPLYTPRIHIGQEFDLEDDAMHHPLEQEKGENESK